MEMNNFREWLINYKKIQNKYAGDVLSRLNRVFKITGSTNITLDSKMLTNEHIKEFSIPVRSQLKRAIALWDEYKCSSKS